MLKCNYLLFVLSLFISFANAKEINCLIAKNQAKCLNNYFSNNTREITIPYGKYYLTETIKLPGNLVLNGNKSNFEFHLKGNNEAAINVSSVKNLTIKNLIISAPGSFAESQIVTGSKAYCGFSNDNTGVQITNSEHISINNLHITGFGHGIVVTGLNNNKLSRDVVITHNEISNVGQTGIRMVYTDLAKIINNNIKNVQGNQYMCQEGIKNSKFADGIYLESVKSILIAYNNISNVKRIGIVADNRYDSHNKLIFVNRDLIINNNTISNVNTCRGTENNAGIWVEPAKVNKANNLQINVQIKNNRIANTNALACHNYQYGILSGADKALISNNYITDFNNNGRKSVGIRCAYGNCDISNNRINNTNIGIMLNDNESNIIYSLNNNVINSNLVDYQHVK